MTARMNRQRQCRDTMFLARLRRQNVSPHAEIQRCLAQAVRYEDQALKAPTFAEASTAMGLARLRTCEANQLRRALARELCGQPA